MPPQPRSGPPRQPTLRDVAQIAGVSIKTVSNVVNDFPHVKASTRQRVREAILQVGYRPQVAAQQLRTGNSGLITLAVPSLAFTYFSNLAQAFSDEAQRRGQTIILHTTTAGRDEELNVLSGFKRVLGDGVVFNPLRLEEAEFAKMERTSQPTVFIGEHLPEALPTGCDYVKIDNENAAFDATSHLLAQGRRRLAFIGAILTPQGVQPHSSGMMRRDGFMRALAEHGVEPGPHAVQEVADWHHSDGVAGLNALMERFPDVDGIVCANDEVAIGALSQLPLHGRRVPEDVAVIGYDDTTQAQYTIPPLTSISPDKHALAVTVLDLLSERIGGYDGPPRTIETPYDLVVRESTSAKQPG